MHASDGQSDSDPWGEAAWVGRTAQRVGLAFTRRNPGRPAKPNDNE
jgi:hypothetical protein